METNRMLKSGFNRFSDYAAVYQPYPDLETVERWPRYSRLICSCLSSGRSRLGLNGERKEARPMRKTDLELLKDAKARQEVERYKWIESEKAGRDIGLERACREWLSKYAAAWRKIHSAHKRFAA
jgi:hypothetical protein